MPQDNCDTGRKIYKSKAEAGGGQAERCDRCKGWHNKADRPKSRAGRKAKRGK